MCLRLSIEREFPRTAIYSRVDGGRRIFEVTAMLTKSLDLRLTLIFSSVFLVFSVVLLVSTHLLLARSLRQEERRALESRLVSYWSTYRYGGLPTLRRELTAEKVLSEERPFMIRIVTPWNEEVFLIMPSSWSKYPLEQLDDREIPTGGRIVTIDSEEDGYSLLVAGVTLPDGYVLQVGISNARRVDLLARYRGVFFLVAVPLAVLSLVGGYFFSARSLGPIRTLSNLTRTIVDTGSLSQRLPPAGTNDELDDLTRSFNNMLGRIEGLVDGIRESLDNVAHDLRTPLTRLTATAESALASGSREDDLRAALGETIGEARKILAMLGALMDVSEAETGVMRLDLSTVDLADLVGDMAELYSYSAEEKGVELDYAAAGAVEATVDVTRIRQAIANLLDNAVKYTPGGGRIRVSVSSDENPGNQDLGGANRPIEGPVALIVVEDTGIGISSADIGHIWDRLFRADRSRSEGGLGLGLATVRAVVTAHGGTVHVESRLGEGSRFTVSLPRSP